MKKKVIHTVVIPGLLSVALLILIQFYLVKNIVDQKKEVFRQKVYQAIEESALAYDKIYTSSKLREKNVIEANIEDYISDKIDSIKPTKKITRIRISEPGNIQSECNLIEADKIIAKTKKQNFHAIDSESTIQIKVLSKKRKCGDSSNMDSFKFCLSDSDITGSFMNDTIQNIKVEFVKDMVDELLIISLNDSNDDEDYYKYFDSLLNINLKNKGINTQGNFQFNITGQNDKVIYAKNNGFEIAENAGYYQSQMFKNKAFMEPRYIKLFIPNENKYLLGKISAALILSLVMIGAVIFFFIITIRNLIKERKLSTVKNDFINNMTHELKTPLTTINLACESAIENIDDRQQTKNKDLLNVIKSESNRLSNVVDLVLKNTFIDKPSFQLKPVLLDVSKLLEDIITEMSILFKKHEADVHLEGSAAFAKVDHLHLKMAIKNVIDNALKYNDNKPEIYIRIFSETRWIKIIIKDNGVGIKKENQKKIYEKFYRIPTGNIHNVKGHGLGLNYTKTIIEKHGGYIDLNSEVDAGSEFILILRKEEDES